MTKKKVEEKTIDEIMKLLIKIGKKDKVLPIKEKIWTRKIDENWKLILNGYKTDKKGLPPANLYIKYDGFPVGLIDFVYNEGFMVDNKKVNEQTFIYAMKKALI